MRCVIEKKRKASNGHVDFFLDVFGRRSQWPTSNVLKAGDDVGYSYFRLCAANSIS